MSVSPPALGVSCSAGMPVDFIYDSGTHDPTHAALIGGPRRGLCGVMPGYQAHTIPNPDGGLCHLCASQVEQVEGRWRVKASAPPLNAHPVLVQRNDDVWDDDD